jgi:hypothetical protein
MAATMKVASHQNPHQNHHHQKKIELSVLNREGPGQRPVSLGGEKNPWRKGSSL